VGSVVVGDAEFSRKFRYVRKMLGGGMRQVRATLQTTFSAQRSAFSVVSFIQ
jgi:threonine aldolase